MARRNKYAALDIRISAAVIARNKRTHAQIYRDKFVWRQLWLAFIGKPCTYLQEDRLLTRRLQALRKRGVLRCAAFNRWKPVSST